MVSYEMSFLYFRSTHRPSDAGNHMDKPLVSLRWPGAEKGCSRVSLLQHDKQVFSLVHPKFDGGGELLETSKTDELEFPHKRAQHEEQNKTRNYTSLGGIPLFLWMVRTLASLRFIMRNDGKHSWHKKGRPSDLLGKQACGIGRCLFVWPGTDSGKGKTRLKNKAFLSLFSQAKGAFPSTFLLSFKVGQFSLSFPDLAW